MYKPLDDTDIFVPFSLYDEFTVFFEYYNLNLQNRYYRIDHNKFNETKMDSIMNGYGFRKYHILKEKYEIVHPYLYINQTDIDKDFTVEKIEYKYSTLKNESINLQNS